ISRRIPNGTAIAGLDRCLGAQAEPCGRGRRLTAKGAGAGRAGMTTAPASPLLQLRSWMWLLLAILCAAGVWLYASRVLIPYQISDAAMHGRPRGNLSDLYLHWVGARELLLNGRDPYGPDVTREIQQGYYGRPLDPARPADPRDQRFAYPVYVVFCLAPTIHLPFEIVRRGFFWVLLGLTVATIPLWLRVL